MTIEMAEQLRKYRDEATRFNKDKLLQTMDQSMGFHEWMEEHKNASSSSERLENELDFNDLIDIGIKAGIPHPFSLESSPFFNCHTRDGILEVKNPRPEDRPFADCDSLALVDIRENEGVALG